MLHTLLECGLMSLYLFLNELAGVGRGSPVGPACLPVSVLTLQDVFDNRILWMNLNAASDYVCFKIPFLHVFILHSNQLFLFSVRLKHFDCNLSLCAHELYIILSVYNEK